MLRHELLDKLKGTSCNLSCNAHQPDTFETGQRKGTLRHPQEISVNEFLATADRSARTFPESSELPNGLPALPHLG